MLKNLKQHQYDALLIAGILVAALILWLLLGLRRPVGATAVITVDGTAVAALPLSRNDRFVWETDSGRNIIFVENGAVRMTEADCPDQICVHRGAIRYEGETIVCLPHKLVVTVTGGESSDWDAVSGGGAS